MNCEKVTFLIEKRAMSKLSFFERFQIKFHSIICKYCVNYEKDSNALNRMLHKLANATEPNKVLDKLEKEKLKEALRNESK